MLKALYEDRDLVVEILSRSFNDNKSVNYIIQQDSHRVRRLIRLMEYSFDYCQLFGEVYLSEDRQACALLVLPGQKKTTVRSILLDLRLILCCVGLSNVRKILAREAAIKKLHPSGPMHYLWFIGVLPEVQHKGIGSGLLREVIARSEGEGVPLYLETSVEKNLPWYEKFGFRVYSELDFGYRLFCLRREG